MPLLVGVVVLMFIAGAGFAYMATRDDSHPKNPPAGGERGGDLDVRSAAFGSGLSLTSQPSEEWAFYPGEYVDGGTLAAWGTERYDEPDAYSFGDVAVVRVNGRSTQSIVGLDTSTGEVLWDLPRPDGGTACWPLEDWLLCERRDYVGLDLVDPLKGVVTGSTDEVSIGYGAPTYDDGRIFLVSTGPDQNFSDLHVTALDTPSLDVGWSTEFDNEGDEFGWVEVEGDVVAVTMWEDYWELDRSDGALLTREPLSEIRREDGWTYTSGYEGAATTAVFAGEGGVQVEAAGDPWYHPEEGTIVDGKMGIGSSLFDLDQGTEEWSRSDLYEQQDDVWWEWTPDSNNVVVYNPNEVVLLDTEDGETVWTVPRTEDFWDPRFTPDALVTLEDQSVIVRDRTSGEVAWERMVSSGNDDYGLNLDLTDVAVTVTNADFVIGFTGFATGSSGSTDDDGTSYTTACGSAPEFVPVASTPANGGITITYEVRATCPGGQWLNLSQLRVPFVVDGDGVSVDAGYLYADGYFDFSADPYWIPDTGETLDLVYPYDQTTVPADDIASAIADDGGGGEYVYVPCEPGPDSYDGSVPSAPEYGADPDDPNLADGGPDQDDTAEDRDESALEALQRIAAEDDAAVEALEWTAQLSSKQPGTYDDGMVYDSYDDILALHLQLRAQFPESLLLYSSDWPGTYGPRSRDYWVTLSGESEFTTRPVLDWCESSGRGTSDCWAVRPSRTGNPGRNVDNAPPDERNN